MKKLSRLVLLTLVLAMLITPLAACTKKDDGKKTETEEEEVNYEQFTPEEDGTYSLSSPLIGLEKNYEYDNINNRNRGK